MDVAHYIDIDNFRHRLDEGLISDFTPYLKGLSINQLRNINAYYRTAEEEGVLDKFEQHISELLASSHDYWAGKEVFQSLVLGNK